MRKIFFFTFISIFFSCKKETTAVDANTIVVDINNKPSAFTVFPFAVYDVVNGKKRLRIGSNKDIHTTTNYVILNLFDFSVGLHKGSEGAVSIYHVADNPSNQYQSDLNPAFTDNTVINITYIDTANVRGTFSGTVYFPFYSSTPPINLTNGKFNVNIKK